MTNQNKETKVLMEQFFGPNLGYIIEKYEEYKKDPTLIDEEMKVFFESLNTHDLSDLLESEQLTVNVNEKNPSFNTILKAVKLAENIRTYGHLAANIYPLNNFQLDTSHLELENYGLTEDDLRNLSSEVMDTYVMSKTALDAYKHLTDVYTNAIAYEFDHVHDANEKKWLMDRVENRHTKPLLSDEKKLSLLKRLVEVESFEKFLHKTFVGQKRFSIEGLDAMVPLIDEMITEAVQDGAEFINIGMAHRGRLNVLAHILHKPYEMIFAEFQHAPNKELVPSEGSIGINFGWTGDVKYHLGLNRQVTGKADSVIAKVSLANNPSHLEYVGAVVEGSTRAAQDEQSIPGYPKERHEKALAILIHGDAAFPGEGIVAETLNLSRLKGYRTGGTIHIIANNTIGFTTESIDSRSTRYASDLAKGFEVPILHVNADNPEACLEAASLAAEYRSVFHKDILIDLIGYRRFGHNEMDEPMTTSPQMYELIHQHPTVKEIYAKQLLSNHLLTNEGLSEMEQQVQDKLEKAYEKVAPKKNEEATVVPDPPVYQKEQASIKTKVPLETLKKINQELLQWPENLNVFHKLAKILERRSEALEENGKVDWALAETLAFATILSDGTPIRLSGQDTERGTFAHRNLVLHDSKTGETYCPLHQASIANASFGIYNSPLTEAAVVGFEYGYNVFSPETLVIWEAQYGDFANVAQVLFDQFIAAGRAKWGQKSGLVLLLPHGYEGQGPEHSSGRMERFLQSAAEKNWTVANLSSASQYFHILRRQAAMLSKEEVRPLIIMSPKSLLRNPLVASTSSDLSEGEFKPVLEEFTNSRDYKKVERILLCTGKMAINISESIRKDNHYDWLQVIRIEEIYPFPTEELTKVINQYPNIKEVYWVQEEPRNMGAWNFVEPRINRVIPEGLVVDYIGRRRRSSPAEGDPNVHKLGQSKIIQAALTRSDEGGKNNG